MSLQRLTTTCPHTHIPHMKPHPTHALQTHIHEGPTEGAPYTHICKGYTPLMWYHHNTTNACHTHSHTHTNYNTHSRAVKHGDARVYVATSTHIQKQQRATQSRQHTNASTQKYTLQTTHNQATRHNAHTQTHQISFTQGLSCSTHTLEPQHAHTRTASHTHTQTSSHTHMPHLTLTRTHTTHTNQPTCNMHTNTETITHPQPQSQT